nr:immunoglobulin light chain junction region [Macaca mulatta]MOV78346.1 immunoglobulin light chain junction region [Macaca mulatta]MOV78567.1 immunoglobulin light chain junction region [Macaca mulatta]MOV78705.1 immunoglobulin light chain junction region [Macaca mulatta]MOV79119.1 immunoglobulin light chain junction region [Macaca mulatta]
CQQGYTYLYSF